MTVKSLRNIYQIKVTLVGSKPAIWRRVLVPNNIRLDRLHHALQITMGWTDSHLHQFTADGVYYGINDPEFGSDCKDESKKALNKLLLEEKDSLLYEYDFGDGWKHKIILEKIVPFAKDIKLPYCKQGKRSCPPEDCGGIWGYHDFLETIQDPKHPEHDEMLEWVGGEFDPEYFSISEVNEELDKYCR